MMEINSTTFGSTVINGKKYEHDVIMTRGKIQEARTQVRHLISKKEFDILAKEKPEVIIIGNGQYSAMEIGEEVKNLAKERNIELIVLPTPQAIKKFNELTKAKRSVIAYFHVTC
jgi:hypothetical protein